MSGILFTPHNALEVLHLRKTQTRRCQGEGDYTWICGMLNRPAVGGDPNVTVMRMAYSQIMGQKDDRHWVKFERGTTKAVVPGRGKRALWYHYYCVYGQPGPHVIGEAYWQATLEMCEGSWKRTYDAAKHNGLRQLRVEIKNLWSERLSEICGPDCIAEGISPIDEQGEQRSEDELRRLYFELWASINTKPGTRVADEPLVWCVEFEVI